MKRSDRKTMALFAGDECVYATGIPRRKQRCLVLQNQTTGHVEILASFTNEKTAEKFVDFLDRVGFALTGKKTEKGS